MDFLDYRLGRNGLDVLFNSGSSVTDILIRGHDFYAIYDESTGLWCRKESEAFDIIDREIMNKAKELGTYPSKLLAHQSLLVPAYTTWKKNFPDNYRPLNSRVIFADEKTSKGDYASFKLPYSLRRGNKKYYDKLMNTLYEPEDLQKLEWAIGSIISGDSKAIQKFIVIYGKPGGGKSTTLNIIADLFKGYSCNFTAGILGEKNNQFSLEPFKDNPLVAIDQDGDLSKIETNTRLNLLVGHDLMTMNEKHKAQYTFRNQAMLFIGSNSEVKITDASSGIIRRLIEVYPSGNKLPPDEYDICVAGIRNELGAIAYHCLRVYKKLGERYYEHYKPVRMQLLSDPFYNFIEDHADIFKIEPSISLTYAYEMYIEYCKESNIAYPLVRYKFRNELSKYFEEFHKVLYSKDKGKEYSVFIGFKDPSEEPSKEIVSDSWLELKEQHSLLDDYLADCKAQYAKDDKPESAWKYVTTKLSDIKTSKVHYVLCPKDIIHIDLDLKDEDGNKNLDLNLRAASAWPKTYAEVSKGGHGLHLTYILDGNPNEVASLYSEGIEIKKSSGLSALRRKVTICNNTPIAHIDISRLPKKENKMINETSINDEKHLRAFIEKNLRKEIHANTAPSIDFIKTKLDEVYASGMTYDISDMYQKLLSFAAKSSHQSDHCIKQVTKMKLKSEAPLPAPENIDPLDDKDLCFFDIEVYPNLLLICYAIDDGPVVDLINPNHSELSSFIKKKLVGYNNKRYDNHIVYGAYLGDNNEQIFRRSRSIINGTGGFIGQAYGISYTDVYDFTTQKQSLKKYEVELGLSHLEMDFDWNEPLPKDKWDIVIDYCHKDVNATRATFHARKEDWIGRKILASIAGMTPNDSTQDLTAAIIFGKGNKNANKDFVYTDLSTQFPGYHRNADGKYEYLGREPGNGGYVFSNPGMYFDVDLFDVESMHPTSIEVLNAFGKYTVNFSGIKNGRLAIKHNDMDAALNVLDGKLSPFLEDPETFPKLAYALKIAINIVYGMTSATFFNAFTIPGNTDNFIAKRGALFMIKLQDELESKGIKVLHIKTDSIKVENPSDDIKDFIMNFARQYGYKFDHEAHYKKLCLIDKAQYIAQDEEGNWTATGKEFQIPYIFKALFTKEKITAKDLFEVKEVKGDAKIYLCRDDEKIFVGKIGIFVPVLSDGYSIMVERNGKLDNVQGTKGYKWISIEDQSISLDEFKDILDQDYYRSKIEEARALIAKFGDAERFLNEQSDFMNPPEDDELPWD